MRSIQALAGLAQRTARRSVLLWATVVGDVAVVLSFADDMTPARLVSALTAVTGVAATVGLWITLRSPRAPLQLPVSAGQAPGT